MDTFSKIDLDRINAYILRRLQWEADIYNEGIDARQPSTTIPDLVYMREHKVEIHNSHVLVAGEIVWTIKRHYSKRKVGGCNRLLRSELVAFSGQ